MSERKRTRDMNTREATEKPRQWRPPELLPDPDKEVGFVYRWIRVSMLNNADPRNISSKLREGWEPVTVEEQPKFKLLVDPRSRFSGSVEIGGLLLCKAPAEMMDQRREYYERKTASQMETVDNNLMSQSDPRMPIFKERRSTTTFGQGN